MDDPLRGMLDSDSRRVAGIMSLDPWGERMWRPEELGAILRHQMSAPVQFDLSALSAGLTARLKKLADAEGLLLKSFADLFRHPHPPIELLVLTKEFAKANGNHPNSPLPPLVARTLYLASIVVAMTRCGTRISQLDDQALHDGIVWALSQPWLDTDIRAVFQEGLDLLGPKRGEGQ